MSVVDGFAAFGFRRVETELSQEVGDADTRSESTGENGWDGRRKVGQIGVPDYTRWDYKRRRSNIIAALEPSKRAHGCVYSSVALSAGGWGVSY